MTKKIFLNQMNRIKTELTQEFIALGETSGLCSLFAYHLPNHRFNALFKPENTNMFNFWLGSISTQEGYNNRMTALEIFEQHCLQHKEYLNF